MTAESQEALVKGAGIVPLVDVTLLPEGPGEAAIIRAAHRWYEHLIALWAPGVIEAAHDLGVFDALAAMPLTSAEVAEAVNADHDATRALLNGLYAYDLVERDRNADGEPVYVLPGEARDCLLPGGLFSLAGKVGYDRRVAWKSWRYLAEAVQSGARDPDGSEQRNQISAGEYETLVNGINFFAPPIVDVLAKALADIGLCQGGRHVRMLDVGCGTGLYSQLLVERFPGLSATGLDTGPIVPLAAAQAERLGVTARFGVTDCDFFTWDWGTGFDLVLFANIFHLQTAETAFALMGKAAAALADGGLVAIADHIIEDKGAGQSTQDRFFRLFAASMLATGGGGSFTTDDYGVWLSRCGLRRVSLLDTPMHRILLAVKA